MHDPTRHPGRLPDIVCLSHLRWNFVFQRPQHLMTRAARERRVVFFEEPVDAGSAVDVEVRQDASGVFVAVPRLPAAMPPAARAQALRTLLDALLHDLRVRDYASWYYTPMALEFSEHLSPLAVVYDCMDELSSFAGAPPDMVRREAQLLDRADLVFTGGQSLFESKVHLHPDVRLFPSSIDVHHFARARSWTGEPGDQAVIRRPRLGYCGVIDERMDVQLVDAVAKLRPDWQFVMLGPVVKIDPASLPRHANLHYLGMKGYEELPAYLAGWDVALMPFARNESTRFISPTKTPEYLAAGRPVVSTSVRDVVRPYGERHLVRIADEPARFVAQAEAAMREDAAQRQQRVDEFLAGRSWDGTWAEMSDLIAAAVASRAGLTVAPLTALDDERRTVPPVQSPVFQQEQQVSRGL